MTTGKRIRIIIGLVVLAALSPFIVTYGYKYAIHLHHRMQEHFAEIHTALSGDDGPDMTDAQMAAMDNVSKPIATGKGMIDWAVLAQAETKVLPGKEQTIAPVFNPAIKKLDGQKLTAKGYMFPLDAFGKQTHFLLSPYPSSCPFCRPAGPNELIEVKPSDPMEFTYDPVIVTGNFQLLKNNDDIQQGMFYRMEDGALDNK